MQAVHRAAFHLRRSLAAALLGVGMAPAGAQPITEAWADVSVPGPYASFYTSVPNEWVWATTGLTQNYALVFTETGVQRFDFGPFAFGNAHASTVVGANRLRVVGDFAMADSGYPANASFATSFVLADASATSRWFDTWTVTGLPAGTPVTLTLQGSLDFSFYGSLWWPRGLPNTYDIRYEVYLQGAPALVLDRTKFDSQAGPQVLDWQLSTEWTAGTPLLVGALFTAYTQGANAVPYAGCGTCSSDLYFDAAHTARFGLVQVSGGGALQSESGLLKVAAGGSGFEYEIAPAPPMPIPEPVPALLFVAGLTVVMRAARRPAA